MIVKIPVCYKKIDRNCYLKLNLTNGINRNSIIFFIVYPRANIVVSKSMKAQLPPVRDSSQV